MSCSFTKRDGSKCGYKVKCNLRCQYHVGKEGFMTCGGDGCKALTASKYGFCAPCGLKNRNEVKKNKVVQEFMELKVDAINRRDVRFDDLLRERTRLRKCLEVIEEDLKEMALRMMLADERSSPIDELISEVVLMSETNVSEASAEDTVKESSLDSSSHN